MNVPLEVINDIKNRARIEEIIGSFIPIIKAGHNYKAVCPFHQDSNPSLHINVDKQIFKCFSCPSENKSAGDVFTFVKLYKKVSYIEAVKLVAEMIGYNYQFSSQPTVSFKETVCHKIIKDTVLFCQNEINSQSGQQVRQYLYDRGIDNTTIREFSIGYNPRDNRLYNYLSAKGYQDSELIEANVARMSERGMSDVFYDRIMIPIYDQYNHPIAFTARTLNKNIDSKYINSTDTQIFKKGEVLYNLNKAQSAIKEQKYVIIAEGPMDVISISKAGFSNVVCSLGTNITDKQLELLKKLTNRVLFAYDGDKAGQSAILRGGILARNSNMEVLVINNNTALDPDEIYRKQGQTALAKMINTPINWMDFIFSHYRKEYDLNNNTQKKQYTNSILQQINLLQDPLDRDSYLTRLAEITGYSRNVLAKETSFSQINKNTTAAKRLNKYTGKQLSQRNILKQLMLSANNCELFQDQMLQLPDKEYDKYVSLIINSYLTNSTFKIANLATQLDDEDYSFLLDILADKNLNENANSKLLLDCCNQLRIYEIEQQKSQLMKQIEASQDQVVKDRYSSQYMELQKKIIEIKRQLTSKEV
ncbi:MAG: DNA primase [Erysipelotrichaceae bacterium]